MGIDRSYHSNSHTDLHGAGLPFNSPIERGMETVPLVPSICLWHGEDPELLHALAGAKKVMTVALD